MPWVCIPDGLARLALEELTALREDIGRLDLGHDSSSYRAARSWVEAELDSAHRLRAWDSSGLGQLLDHLQRRLK